MPTTPNYPGTPRYYQRQLTDTTGKVELIPSGVDDLLICKVYATSNYGGAKTVNFHLSEKSDGGASGATALLATYPVSANAGFLSTAPPDDLSSLFPLAIDPVSSLYGWRWDSTTALEVEGVSLTAGNHVNIIAVGYTLGG